MYSPQGFIPADGLCCRSVLDKLSFRLDLAASYHPSSVETTYAKIKALLLQGEARKALNLLDPLMACEEVDPDYLRVSSLSRSLHWHRIPLAGLVWRDRRAQHMGRDIWPSIGHAHTTLHSCSCAIDTLHEKGQGPLDQALPQHGMFMCPPCIDWFLASLLFYTFGSEAGS